MPCCKGPNTCTSRRSGAVIKSSAVRKAMNSSTRISRVNTCWMEKNSTPARPSAAIICTTGVASERARIKRMLLCRLRSLASPKMASSCRSALNTLMTRWPSSASLATRVTSPIEVWMRVP